MSDAGATDCKHVCKNPFNSCSANGQDFYCVKCLWEITESYPVTLISKSKFDTQEDDITWFEGAWRDLKYDPDNFHSRRVANADLSYPIIVCLIENQYVILDGCHRFIKEATEWVNAKIVSQDELNKIKIFEF